jgi:hypothetical protein
LGDDPEAHYSAAAWELLVHLHKSEWQVLVCDRRPGEGYLIEEGRPKHICLRGIKPKMKTCPVLSRSYLLLLSTADTLRFPHEIPHLGREEHYAALVDCAFPHHAKDVKRKVRQPLQNLDADADVMAMLALLSGIPDPVNQPAPLTDEAPAGGAAESHQTDDDADNGASDDPSDQHDDEEHYDSDFDDGSGGDEESGGGDGGDDGGAGGGGGGGTQMNQSMGPRFRHNKITRKIDELVSQFLEGTFVFVPARLSLIVAHQAGRLACVRNSRLFLMVLPGAAPHPTSQHSNLHRELGQQTTWMCRGCYVWLGGAGGGEGAGSDPDLPGVEAEVLCEPIPPHMSRTI